MLTIFLVIFIIILVKCDTTVVTDGLTENVTPRSSRLGEDSDGFEPGTSEKLASFTSQGSRSNVTVFHRFWENERKETRASSTFDQAADISLTERSSNSLQDEKERLQLMRRRRDINEASSFQMTRLAIAMETLELENRQLKSTVKELQSATKNFSTKEQESSFAVSQLNSALQQQQLAIGQLQLQVSQLSTNTMKLQDENEALRAQMRLRMEDTDSRHERMQSMMLMISNLTTKLQAENSSIYSQLLKVSDLTSGLQAENDSIYLQLLKVSDLTTELQAENGSIYSQLLKVSDLTSWLQSENSSIYTQLLNVGDLMVGLQSDNSSIYSQLQALSADVIQRGAQYEEQHTALQEKVRMLQTQTTNLDSNLSKRSSALEERLTSHVTQLQQKDQELVQMVIRRTSVDLIGFHARLTDDVDAPNPKTLVLDRVEYNAGGGYDSTTGIFTAPVTGLYLFLATIGASSGDAAAQFYIEVNGNPRTSCFSKYSTNLELSTCHGADRVVKGQRVRIVTEGYNRRIRGIKWTTFTVVLIQRED